MQMRRIALFIRLYRLNTVKIKEFCWLDNVDVNISDLVIQNKFNPESPLSYRSVETYAKRERVGILIMIPFKNESISIV